MRYTIINMDKAESLHRIYHFKHFFFKSKTSFETILRRGELILMYLMNNCIVSVYICNNKYI